MKASYSVLFSLLKFVLCILVFRGTVVRAGGGEEVKYKLKSLLYASNVLTPQIFNSLKMYFLKFLLAFSLGDEFLGPR